MSNPAHSVEHIEKQQRSITPQEQVPMRSKSITQADRKSMPAYFLSSSLGIENKNGENGFNFLRSVSPQQQSTLGTSPLATFMSHNLTLEEPEVSRSSPLATFLDTPQKPHLLPPTMFTSSVSKERDSTSILPESTEREVPLLTKNQLQQAFSYLLKNDSDFIAKMHEAYIKSVNEKLSYTNGNSVK